MKVLNVWSSLLLGYHYSSTRLIIETENSFLSFVRFFYEDGSVAGFFDNFSKEFYASDEIESWKWRCGIGINIKDLSYEDMMDKIYVHLIKERLK